ncbi:MAG: hypothetical protein JJU37_11380 [Balneolaceae bacterium]|nr:hypothetical protein [Balneolaceae bacterium]
MKKAGLIILAFGLLLSLFTGFNYVTKEKIVEIGDLEISADRTNRASWSPMIGIAVMTVGGILFIMGGKEK